MDTIEANVSLVRGMYANFTRGDITGLLEAISPSVEWSEPSNPFNPAAGTRHGYAGVVEWLRIGHEAEEILALESNESIAQDGMVVVIGHSRCRARRTGRVYETDFAHVVTVKDGQIRRFQEFFDTYAAADAFKPVRRAWWSRSMRLLALASVFGGFLLAFLALVQPWYARWGATDEEVAARLPGDAIISDATSQETRAITIDRPIERVWPWLAQLGQDRGGFYSFDALENLVGSKMPTGDVPLPDRQAWAVGERLWMYPPERAGGIGFAVLREYEPGRALAFGTHVPGAAEDVDTGSWTFALRKIDPWTTRLIIRWAQSSSSWLGRAFDRAILSPMHFVMERRTMIGLKEVAEYGSRARLANHAQVVLWVLTLGAVAVAKWLVLTSEHWVRALKLVAAAAALFAYLTLGQPSWIIGGALLAVLIAWTIRVARPAPPTPVHLNNLWPSNTGTTNTPIPSA